MELAIAGNVIDFGVKNNVNVNEELKKILLKEKVKRKAVITTNKDLKISKAKSIPAV